MTKKLSFNDLPAAVGRILEILTSEGSDYTALPELVKRITRLEKQIDYLQIIASPDKPVMDMQTVCRILKLKPKAVYELAEAGILPSREQGNKTVFYEEGVVKFYVKQPAWKAAMAAAKPTSVTPVSDESITEQPETDERKRVDINIASAILGRNTGAIYQLTSNNRIPFHKDGKKIYFYTDELQEWAQRNPPRKRKKDTAQ